MYDVDRWSVVEFRLFILMRPYNVETAVCCAQVFARFSCHRNSIHNINSPLKKENVQLLKQTFIAVP